MAFDTLLTENRLDNWVRGNAEHAQGVIVELVSRLVAASCPRPKYRRFPLGDSIGQHGPDGELYVDISFEPFVPEGHSFWEIGTGLGAQTKAAEDYEKLTAATPEAVRRKATFVFVTPLSGRKDWPRTRKKDDQAAWVDKRRKLGQWRDVRVIDGTILIDWLQCFPAVERWLGPIIDLPLHQMETPEEHWELLRAVGAPPELKPQLFLTNRDTACAKVNDVFSGTTAQLKLDTYFPGQVFDFVSAHLAAMDKESRIDAVSRCLFITDGDAWNVIADQKERHVLIVDSGFDPDGTDEARLLQKSLQTGHAVVYRGAPGGIPHPNCAKIVNPKDHQIRDALEHSGYSEERARNVTSKSGGDLGSLIRLLLGLSQNPKWAEAASSAEHVVAELLGSWNDKSKADILAVESLSGQSYPEWIGKIREVLVRPDPPLTHRDGIWRFVPRYEGWYALGPRVFDDHLERFQKVAVTVLRERDPKFELTPEERFGSQVQGKVLRHSDCLRKGLAETLALLGSHRGALTSCTFGKAEIIAVRVVGMTLENADWVHWAGLDRLLPLLAEAAPEEFLDAVERALKTDPCPFDEMFAQEISGITGANWLSGLLWALETLAWDANYLGRVILLLGELAERDPGGNWANRPANSLRTILLPWRPQTCAMIAKRKAAVNTLLDEFPSVAWPLLLSLLDEPHSSSFGTRRPAWRELIPEDWTGDVWLDEYWEQVGMYADLAIGTTKADPAKLMELIDHFENLPPPAREGLLAHLESPVVTELPEPDRLGLWTKLFELVVKHRKFAHTKWALNPEQVDDIGAIAKAIEPTTPRFRYRRLFSEDDFALYEEIDNYHEQRKELEERRRGAVDEISATDGVRGILEFAEAVESPWRVGIAFGEVAENPADEAVLPELLEKEIGKLAQFAGGFVSGRFRARGWQWVDEIDVSLWTPTQIGELLALLPFTSDAWERSARLLGEDDSSYWATTYARASGDEEGLEQAVDRLIEHGRAHAAISCLHSMQFAKRNLDPEQVVRALMAVARSSDGAQRVDSFEILEIIKALQNNPDATLDQLCQVEWAHLPVLRRHDDASPMWLERRMATEPQFFCKLIRTASGRENKEQPTQPETEEAQTMASQKYDAYCLLDQWGIPPGLSEDGSFDAKVLAAWLDAVTEECKATGHLEEAMWIAGQVLVHAPADPDGLWIHRAVAKVLDAGDAEEMRTGFHMALCNTRGLHAFTAGKKERALAEKYQEQAEAVEMAGFLRLAGTLRQLATDYERQAEYNATRRPFED